MEGKPDLSYRLDSYDFELPQELIAQTPAEKRDRSGLMVLDRRLNSIEHSRFDRIGRCFRPGDLLVLNDTKVVPARLFGKKESGGKVELLVLDPCKPLEAAEAEGYCCLPKASKPFRPGQAIHLKEGIVATVAAVPANGTLMVRFPDSEPLTALLDRIGEIPLPPYILRNETTPSAGMDGARYQTEYAKIPGAVAAPTAGLHLAGLGVETAFITLHVGYGTFSPVRCEDVREHKIHSEHVEIGEECAARIREAKSSGRRVVAVGTTVVRTIEWAASTLGKVAAVRGPCGHYIYPGYRFQVVDALITNFHLPRSSLLLLVSAFAGRETILSAYEEAKRLKYRFYGYGDAMFIV